MTSDSYLLKMTLGPSSRVMSVVCWHAFGLAKYLDTLTDGLDTLMVEV